MPLRQTLIKPHTQQLYRRLWTPRHDAGAVAWYDPSDLGRIHSSSNLLDQLKNKIADQYHLSSLTVRRPVTGVTTINGRNCLVFSGPTSSGDGNDHINTVITLPSSGNVSFFAVVDILGINATDDAPISYLNFSNPGVNDFNFRSNSGINFMGRIQGYDPVSANQKNIDFSGGPFGFEIFEIVFDFSSNTVKGYTTGTQRVSDNNYTTKLEPIGNLKLMGQRLTSGWVYGLLGGVIVTESVDQATRQKHEGYLAHKWGLTAKLPISHPYKQKPPLLN